MAMRDRGQEFATYARIKDMNLTLEECHSMLAALWVTEPMTVALLLDVVQAQRDRAGS